MNDSMNLDHVLEDCVRYWLDTGVAAGAIADMRTELESHLHEAAAAGKPLESVIGDDREIFAEAWAIEARGTSHREHPVDVAHPAPPDPPRPPAGRVVGVGAIGGLAFVVAIAALGPKEANVEDMQIWQWLWSVAAVVLGIGEMITAGFFLLPFAVGAAAAALLSFLSIAVPFQIGAFIFISVAALWAMNKYARADDHNTLPVGATWYIDATATVIEDIDPVAGSGRVRVETEQWRATTDIGAPIPAGTEVRVAEVRGARLVVEPKAF